MYLVIWVRDRFIAGHSSCELWRNLDSVPPETPIRDVVDRCHVWESHADPAVRRVSKPSPDPIYLAYVVGDSDNISKTTQVAAVTGPKSGTDQLEDLLRRLLMAVDTPAPIPEVPAVEKLLTASGGRDTESSVAGRESSGFGGIGEDAMVVPLWTTANEAATSTATHPMGLERSRGMLRLGARLWMSRFHLCCRDGRGGGYYDPTPGGDGPTADGKRRLIRGRGSPPGSVVMFDPRIQGEGQCRLLFPDR